jgi:hypothetical protein
VFEFISPYTGKGVLILKLFLLFFSNLGEAQASWSPCDHLDLSLMLGFTTVSTSSGVLIETFF